MLKHLIVIAKRVNYPTFSSPTLSRLMQIIRFGSLQSHGFNCETHSNKKARDGKS